MMPQVTDHYSTDELTCRDGCGYGDDPADYGESWKTYLSIRRRLLNRPSVPTSGKRCEDHNEAEGGVPDSAHLRDALDEKTDGGHQRFEAILATVLAAAVQDGLMLFATARRVMEGLRYARLGVGIAKTFHHVDRDPVRRADHPSAWKY
jgi:hypothetical protein